MDFNKKLDEKMMYKSIHVIGDDEVDKLINLLRCKRCQGIAIQKTGCQLCTYCGEIHCYYCCSKSCCTPNGKGAK